MPDALLHESRSLASSERRLLSSFVTESEAAIARCGFEHAAECVGAMGDRWDGIGSAVRTGEGTPEPGASLTSILTVFLAMTEPRAYRNAFSTLDAVEHLRRGAGFLYSPAAVDALIATFVAGHR